MARCSCGEGLVPGARTCMGGCVIPSSVAELEQLRAENEKLRSVTERITEHAASFMGRLDPLIYTTRKLEATIRSLLASAVPHPGEHPTMWRAWRDAEAVLGIPPEKSHTVGPSNADRLLPMLSSTSKPGDKVFTYMHGFVELVREMNGESGVDGWEAKDRTERFIYLTYADFKMTAAEVAEVRRILAEARGRRP